MSACAARTASQSKCPKAPLLGSQLARARGAEEGHNQRVTNMPFRPEERACDGTNDWLTAAQTESDFARQLLHASLMIWWIASLISIVSERATSFIAT